MNEQEVKIHDARILKGRQATVAYNSFLKDFILEQHAELFEAFMDAPVEAEALLEIKRMQLVLTTLESNVKTHIAMGDESQRALTEGRDK
jgi:hypothetical protein